MIRLVCYFVLLVLIAHIFMPYSYSDIHEDLVYYEQEYMRQVKEFCKEDQYFYPNHDVEFSDLEDDTIGICYRYPNRFIIHIDKPYWENMSYDDRIQLMFHELQHCIFGTTHTEDKNHFMYYQQIDLPRQVLYQQLRTLLRSECQK